MDWTTLKNRVSFSHEYIGDGSIVVVDDDQMDLFADGKQTIPDPLIESALIEKIADDERTIKQIGQQSLF